MTIIDRAEAKSQGLRTYFTGVPCSRGRVANRVVSTKRCTCDLCVTFDRERKRAHHNQNRSSINSKQRTNYQKDRIARLVKVRAYRSENLISILEAQARYRDENRAVLTEKRRAYFAQNRASEIQKNKTSYKKNREAILAKKRGYYFLNKQKFFASSARRRAVKKSRMPLWFGEFDAFVIDEAYSLAELRRELMGIGWHVDHMVPLLCGSASGLHCGMNVQVIPQSLNQQKHNKLWLHEPLAWVLEL